MKTFPIPFCGFFNSVIDDEIETTIECEVQYYSEEYGIELDEMDFITDFEGIAKCYARYFEERAQDAFPQIQIKFSELISPKYYNYTTDKIYCEISDKNLKLVYKYCIANHFSDIIKERLKVRDGFIPLYSDDFSEWDKDVLAWDDAQIGLLFEHFVTLLDKNEGVIISDIDFMDYSSSHGYIYENVHATGKSKELIDNLED